MPYFSPWAGYYLFMPLRARRRLFSNFQFSCSTSKYFCILHESARIRVSRKVHRNLIFLPRIKWAVIVCFLQIILGYRIILLRALGETSDGFRTKCGRNYFSKFAKCRSVLVICAAGSLERTKARWSQYCKREKVARIGKTLEPRHKKSVQHSCNV